MVGAVALDIFKFIGYAFQNSIYESEIKHYDKKIERKTVKQAEEAVKDLDEVVKDRKEDVKEADDNDVVNIKAPSVVAVKDEYEGYIDRLAAERSQGSYPIKLSLTVAGKKANKWINYAIYWMTADKDIGILAVDHETAQFINAIAQMFGFNQKIYEDEKVANLKNYDPDYPDEYVGDAYAKFLVSIRELEKRITAQFIVAMKKRETFLQQNKHVNGISPLFTSIDNTGVAEDVHIPFDFIGDDKKEDIVNEKQTSNVDDVVRSKLDQVLDPYLGNTHHYYEKYTKDLTLLHVRRGDDVLSPYETYIVDHNGILLGGGVPAVVAPISYTNPVTNTYDTVMLPIADEFKEILTKVFGSAFYQLTNDEFNQVVSSIYYLNDQYIYHWLDFTNRNFTNLNADERMEFSNKLTFVSQLLWSYFPYQLNNGGADIPRMRFTKYADIHNWVLISDNLTSSPFSDDGTTSAVVADGLTVICDHDKITFTDGNGKDYNFN